ncbi:hypothetical protein PIB30_048931 [Stylosanthes scabra]|uniref:Putative plant transposon protein domain-containing protein n=1 Tax=Stylosanthes scabra TaxID=79078 RepID=A0ABU6XF04_9FABA|nr:hypothetical protein [Stylosanthes scabra]
MADYDDHLFLSLFNQNMFEEFARSKDIISEKGFELKHEEYPEIRNQIALRGWKRLASPRTKVKVLMIKEFFANAARTQEEMDEEEQHPLKSFVRGVEVDFSPANIKRVMRFKDNTPGAETNYNTRLHSNQMLEEVLRDLCILGATWNNRSEVTVARVILIHSILKGEDDAGVPFREYRGTPNVDEESTITAKVMETVRGGAVPIVRRHQEEEADHDEDQNQEEEAGHDEDQDQVMYEAENVYEPPHQQSYVEHETGAESWENHEVQYEQQQHNYYEPHQSPHQQPQQQQPQPQIDFYFQVFQEQQQQGIKAMTDLMTNMQIETLNYFENIKTYQEYQYDQMKAIIAQQQEVIDTQNKEFQVMKSKQDQLEKELSEIRKAQVNLAMYKSNSSNQAMDGSNEELQRLRKIIEDQRVALVQQNRAAVGSSQIASTTAASLEGKLDQIASSVAGFKEELATFKERHEQLANLSY